MTEEQSSNERGFGTIQPESERLITRDLLLVVFWGGVAAAVCAAAGLYIANHGIERTPPEIVYDTGFISLTPRGAKLDITVEDAGSGLSSVLVSIHQGDRLISLAEGMLDRAPKFYKSLDLNPAALKLQDGPAELIIEAVDDSVWHSRSLRVQPFLVDTKSPTVEIVSSSPEVSEGGTGSVVYRAADANMVRSGVRVGAELFFPGTPAGAVDPQFVQPDLFVVFFTVPPGESGSLRVVVEDSAGNDVQLRLATTVSRRSNGTVDKMNLTSGLAVQLARSVFNAVLASGRGVFDTGQGRQLLSKAAKGDRAADVEIARLLTSSCRDADFQRVRRLLSEHLQESRRWEGLPMLGIFGLKLRFNDVVQISDSTGELLSQQVRGQVLESVTGEGAVLAPYAGTVRFAQDMDVLGKTIVIDHGVGVASMFSSLSGVYVDWGATVEKGQKIGQIGSSGFAFLKQLNLFVLIHGIPVDPAEWFDKKRYQEVIEGPLNGARKKFGIPITRSGERL